MILLNSLSELPVKLYLPFKPHSSGRKVRGGSQSFLSTPGAIQPQTGVDSRKDGLGETIDIPPICSSWDLIIQIPACLQVFLTKYFRHKGTKTQNII
jgi:hypothetical protein